MKADGGSRPGLKLALAVALVGIGLALAFQLGAFEPEFHDRLQAALRALGPWGPAAFFGLVVATVLLAMPAPPVLLLGGLLFGAVMGGLLSLSGLLLATTCSFFLSRRLGREAVAKHLAGPLAALDERLGDNGLSLTLFWRLMPVLPDSGMNYGGGLTRLRFRDYALGTALGILPGVAIYSHLGSLALGATPARLGLGFAALALLALLPIGLRRFRHAGMVSPLDVACAPPRKDPPCP